MKYSPKEITLIALIVALIVVFGFVFYFMSYLLPLPGAKFIFLSLFLSFMLYFPLYRLQRRGIVIALTGAFALIMSFISVFMGLAIFSAGILTEILALLLRAVRIDFELRTVIISAVFPCFSTITFLTATIFLIEAEVAILNNLGWKLMILLFLILMLGMIGAVSAYYVDHKYINLD